jgi:transposase
VSSRSLEKHYHINADQLGQQYKDHLSDYHSWDQKEHACEWLLFPDNIGPSLSIDETSPSNGELYTVVTNNAAKGQKGAIVAMAKGTGSGSIISVLKQIPEASRKRVTEVTLDMAASMHKIVKQCFPKACRVIDRFHVQKLAYDALQEMRIAHRWDAIREEAEAVDQAKYGGECYEPLRFLNGDSKKQLLARSRYLLFKSPSSRSGSQTIRAQILLAQYPDIQKAYSLTHQLRTIFNLTKDKAAAYTKLARWYNNVACSEFKAFNAISATIYSHYPEILNFFDNRGTNASAESFNAKIQAFRATLRGVSDINFSLYRLCNIYA